MFPLDSIGLMKLCMAMLKDHKIKEWKISIARKGRRGKSLQDP
jgi:hypothetical protein